MRRPPPRSTLFPYTTLFRSCLVHGDGLGNMYRWKNTIGNIEERVEQRNIWGYHQTAGLGFFEYFQFCEDIGAKPDRKSTRLNSSHSQNSYAVFCLKKKTGRGRHGRRAGARDRTAAAGRAPQAQWQSPREAPPAAADSGREADAGLRAGRSSRSSAAREWRE